MVVIASKCSFDFQSGNIILKVCIFFVFIMAKDGKSVINLMALNIVCLKTTKFYRI